MEEKPQPKGAGLNGLYLAAAILLVALLVAGLVPLVNCPRCTEWNFFGPFENWDVHSLSEPCRVCHDRRKTSLLQKWAYRFHHAPGTP